jgi:hypothetical protein
MCMCVTPWLDKYWLATKATLQLGSKCFKSYCFWKITVLAFYTVFSSWSWIYGRSAKEISAEVTGWRLEDLCTELKVQQY